MSNYRGVTNVRCDIIKRPTGRVVWWFKPQPDEPSVEYVPVPGITPATREEASLAYDYTVEKVKEAIPPHWKVRYGSWVIKRAVISVPNLLMGDPSWFSLP
jgi:hypothetical protein